MYAGRTRLDFSVKSMATKRVRFNCEREEEQAQIPSPTKRMRLEATHEEEEEMDDASGSLDMDASQMCPRSQVRSEHG